MAMMTDKQYEEMLDAMRELRRVISSGVVKVSRKPYPGPQA